MRAVSERDRDRIGEKWGQLLRLGRGEVEPDPVIEDQPYVILVVPPEAGLDERDAPAIDNYIVMAERAGEGHPEILIDGFSAFVIQGFSSFGSQYAGPAHDED